MSEHTKTYAMSRKQTLYTASAWSPAGTCEATSAAEACRIMARTEEMGTPNNWHAEQVAA